MKNSPATGTHVDTDKRLNWPLLLVCPRCRAPLQAQNDAISCPACSSQYSFCAGFPDLIVGTRFEDSTGEEQLRYEEQSNEALTRDYLIPLFRRIFPRHLSSPRVLSLGCGTGVDVDLLCREGFDCFGIDCGNRTAIWPRRVMRDRLLLANGKHLPFESGTFDLVFCGCVFPHVGVVGDTFVVTPHFSEERLALSREMARVLKPDGRILVSSPNRRFLFDLFHGRPHGGYKPRLNRPADPFLLSVEDYRQLFRDSGWGKATPQPVQGYWGFVRSKRSFLGRLLALPIRFAFWLVSRESFHGLRGSFLSPWIVVMLEKGDER